MHAQHLEMPASSNPNSTDKLRIHLTIQSCDFRDDSIDSCPRFAHNNCIPRPDWNQKIKMKIPLSPHQHNSSSLILAPPANPRVTLTLEKAIEYELKHGRKLDPNMDRKKLRRTISNRLSAQRSRMKKAQYINDMEKMAKDLEELISVLTPQIESYKEKRKLLLLQNDSLQKHIEIRSNESKFCEIELERKRVEVYRLKELEKTVKKNSHDSNFGPQQMQDLRFKQFTAQPYMSLGFYQNGLQHLQKFGSNHFCQQQLPSSALVQSGLKMAPYFGFEQPGKDQPPGFMIKLPVEVLTPEKNQEEADIDQYFNFEALNVDPASV